MLTMSASAGGLDDAERDCFSDGDDEQRAFGMSEIGDGGNVFNDTEEVG